MSQTFALEQVAILTDLRRLVADGRFHEAMTRIADLERAGVSIDDKEDYARFLSFKSIVFFQLSDYDQALDAAKQALALVKGTANNELIAELQSTVARSYTEMGKLADAEREYRDLIATYRRVDDTAGVIRSLNRLSRVQFIRGQFDKATEYLLEASDYADTLADRKWQAKISGNLGTILNLTGQFFQAKEFLERSVLLNRQLGDERNLCRAYLSLAFTQMHLKQLRAAEASLAEAEAIVNSSEFETERLSLGQYRALLFLQKSEPAKALEIAQEILNRARESAGSNATICQLGRLVAEAQQLLGSEQAALKAATQALKVAERIGERVEIGACQRILGQLKHKLQTYAEADEHFADAVNHLGQCGARFELAMTYLAWSHATADPSSRSEYRLEASRILSSLKLEALYTGKPVARRISEENQVILVGDSPSFTAVVRQASICASSDIPVLLLGETGSGKDQLARFIHHHSGRAKGALVQLNCATIPVDLAESELFGYEKGAFTNANDRKIGLIEAANGGTLFLNEIGELPPKLQSKFLAALEDKRFLKLGGTTPRTVDFRLIAATNVDLADAVRQGKFRADLYYRLAVMTLRIPRLASRGADAYLLLEHFMESDQLGLDSVDSQTLEALKAACQTYDWPGNVREVKNYVELFSLTERRDVVSICLRLIERLKAHSVANPERMERMALNLELQSLEQSRIRVALSECGGVIRRAAAYLGLPEATLRSKLRKYDIRTA